MNVGSLVPTPISRTQFQLNALSKAPHLSGCYVLTDFSGHILYIGQSKNMHRRMNEHLDSPAKTNATPEGRAIWFYWAECENSGLNALERGWLQAHSTTEGALPIMNSVSAPI